MIRQAISCDVCGRDMQESSRWMAAVERGSELRLSVWNPRGRVRVGVRHLCGQTCLYKMLDEFIAHTTTQASNEAEAAAKRVKEHAASQPARALSETAAVRKTAAAPHPVPVPVPVPIHAESALDEFESSARLLTDAEVAAGKNNLPERSLANTNPRTWSAEAWKRERERANKHGSEPRRRSFA